MKKVISGIMLMLLVLSMLTLAINIQPVKSMQEPPLLEWNRTYGGTARDWADGLVETTDGGYALAGCTGFLGSTNGDVWLIRTDSAGNALWNRTYGGTNDDEAWDLAKMEDGGFALVGITSSFGAGGYDAWLIRTDSNGNQLWNRTYGGTSDDYGFDLVETSDGGFALIGQTGSFGAGSYDLWLVKTDASGNMQWNKTYGGTNDDWGCDLVEMADGGYVMAGSTSSFGAGGYDFWLIRTDADGNHIWNMTYGGTSYDLSAGLVATRDGGYALVGRTESYGAGDIDIWLLKTNATGNVQWSRTYGGFGKDLSHGGLVEMSDGGYALVGHTNSFGAGDYDFWLIRTAADGNHIWNQTYGGVNLEVAQALIETSDAGIALAGYTASYGAGAYDAWLVKLMPEKHYLTVQTDPSGLAAIAGEGWYDIGTDVELTAPAFVPSAEGGGGSVRFRFDYWDVDGEVVEGNPINVHMNANHTATAHYVLQYCGSPWIKYSENPLDLGGDTQDPCVIYDGLTFRMWYAGMGQDNVMRIYYATSLDGISWALHGMVLDVGASGSWDCRRLSKPAVLFDGTMFKMWYMGVGESTSIDGMIGYATSSNGIDWTKYVGNPVMVPGGNGGWDDHSVGDHSVFFNGTHYLLWYAGWPYRDSQARVGVATSVDGVVWTKYPNNPVMTYGPSAWDNRHVFPGAVLRNASYYLMWYTGQCWSAPDRIGGDRIGLAVSPDGFSWMKYEGSPVLDWGPVGSWETSVNRASVVEKESKLMMWYTGVYQNNVRIGLATQQYYLRLTTSPLNITLPIGGGWYDPETYASISAEEYVYVASDMRYRFSGWTTADVAEIIDPASVSTMVLMNKDKTVTANYVIQYYLAVKTDPAGLVTIPGEGWYDECTSVELLAPPTAYYMDTKVMSFNYWAVDGATIVGNPITVYMDAPHTATAYYYTPAVIDIKPDALNLRSEGEWITAYIELPEGYNPVDINVSSMLLNDTIPAEPGPITIGDYDNDTVPDLMVKFNRTEVISYISDQGISYGDVTLTITGELTDGPPFEGSDIIRVIFPRSHRWLWI